LSVVSGPATISSNVVTLTGTGSVTVRAVQEGNLVYAAAPSVDRTFVVKIKRSQTISFAPLTDRIVGDPPSVLSASASSGLPVSFSVVSGPVTVSGDKLTVTGMGTVIVRASQGGDDLFDAAPNLGGHLPQERSKPGRSTATSTRMAFRTSSSGTMMVTWPHGS
jgi:hypothetical protein